MGRTGAGGYGGISTMNQDQRGPRYGPHMLISTHTDHPSIYVKCLKCKQLWQHPIGERTFPAECQPSASEASADDDEAIEKIVDLFGELREATK